MVKQPLPRFTRNKRQPISASVWITGCRSLQTNNCIEFFPCNLTPIAWHFKLFPNLFDATNSHYFNESHIVFSDDWNSFGRYFNYSNIKRFSFFVHIIVFSFDTHNHWRYISACFSLNHRHHTQCTKSLESMLYCMCYIFYPCTVQNQLYRIGWIVNVAKLNFSRALVWSKLFLFIVSSPFIRPSRDCFLFLGTPSIILCTLTFTHSLSIQLSFCNIFCLYFNWRYIGIESVAALSLSNWL